jgi:hypothetical protein
MLFSSPLEEHSLLPGFLLQRPLPSLPQLERFLRHTPAEEARDIHSRMVLSSRFQRIQRTLARDPVALDDRLRMNLHVHQPLALPQQLARQHADGGRSVSDLVVLDFGNVDEDLCGSVVEGDGLEDGRTVVCDGDLAGGGGLWRGSGRGGRKRR